MSSSPSSYRLGASSAFSGDDRISRNAPCFFFSSCVDRGIVFAATHTESHPLSFRVNAVGKVPGDTEMHHTLLGKHPARSVLRSCVWSGWDCPFARCSDAVVSLASRPPTLSPVFFSARSLPHHGKWHFLHEDMSAGFCWRDVRRSRRMRCS